MLPAPMIFRLLLPVAIVPEDNVRIGRVIDVSPEGCLLCSHRTHVVDRDPGGVCHEDVLCLDVHVGGRLSVKQGLFLCCIDQGIENRVAVVGEVEQDRLGFEHRAQEGMGIGIVRPPVEQQDTETKDVGTMELTEDGSYICYLCGCRIPAKLNTDNRCRKCGDRACFSCLELVDTPDGLCAYCDYKARMWHKSAFVCTVIVVIITLCFLLIRLFPEHRQTISNSLGL